MLKKILIGIVALVVLVAIVGFFMPEKTEVTRTVAINAPADYVFEEVNELKNWGRWSYWHHTDKTMKPAYGDVTAGVNAFYSWTSEQGEGNLKFTESVPNQSIKYELNFAGDPAAGWYTFEKDGETTKLTSGFSYDHGANPFSRLMGKFMFVPEMNKAFDFNHDKLKEIAEAKPKFTVNISEENTSPISYIGVSSSMSFEDQNAISAQMGKSYGELMTALTKSKVQMTGPAFCLYPKWDEATKTMEMVCALPVPNDAKVPAKYKVMQTSGGKVVKAIHTGDYANLDATHNQIDQYIAYKKLEISGAPWEVYITDPMVEKDTSKWVTEVYYPVK
ncbi:MAG: GyrI-like domain-containing protein [Flammeovirgaceae bacterium]|nr:GyrI-like domain-containing protein [Flammeovirgaceae bacterium]